jgi:hypothetical protein
MKIINSYHHADAQLKSWSEIRQEFVIKNHRPITTESLDYVKNLIQGSVMIVHSGSWNFDIDAVYIEPKHYQQLSFNFHPNTKFVNYPFDHTVKKLLARHPVDRLLFLHSPLTKYLNSTQLIEFLDEFKYLLNSNGSIIAVIDLLFLNFNRLTTSYSDIACQLNAVKQDNDLIICR